MPLLQRTDRRPAPFIQFSDDEYPTIEQHASIGVDVLLSRWPETVPERLDRCLCNLGRESREYDDLRQVHGNTVALLFARSRSEAMGHVRGLEELGRVLHVEKDYKHAVSLTARGWQRFTELQERPDRLHNPAFVAMWFGGKDEATRRQMEALYTDAIAPAVLDAGYKVKKADSEPHNEYIMDRVIGDIRRAPFVVAEYTGHNEGVYYEAGFAKGLGIPVINCCSGAAFTDAHFDTKQLYHLKYATPDELRGRLFHHILATMGDGPLRAE